MEKKILLGMAFVKMIFIIFQINPKSEGKHLQPGLSAMWDQLSGMISQTILELSMMQRLLRKTQNLLI